MMLAYDVGHIYRITSGKIYHWKEEWEEYLKYQA